MKLDIRASNRPSNQLWVSSIRRNYHVFFAPAVDKQFNWIKTYSLVRSNKMTGSLWITPFATDVNNLPRNHFITRRRRHGRKNPPKHSTPTMQHFFLVRDSTTPTPSTRPQLIFMWSKNCDYHRLTTTIWCLLRPRHTGVFIFYWWQAETEKGRDHPAHLKYLQHRKWINIQAVTHLVVHFGFSTAYKIHAYNTLLEGKWKPQ